MEAQFSSRRVKGYSWIQSWIQRYSDTELDTVRAGNYVNYLGWWPSSEHHDGPVANIQLNWHLLLFTRSICYSIHYLPMAASALSRFVHASQLRMWVIWLKLCVSSIALPVLLVFVQEVWRSAMPRAQNVWMWVRVFQCIGLSWFELSWVPLGELEGSLARQRWNIGISALPLIIIIVASSSISLIHIFINITAIFHTALTGNLNSENCLEKNIIAKNFDDDDDE